MASEKKPAIKLTNAEILRRVFPKEAVEQAKRLSETPPPKSSPRK